MNICVLEEAFKMVISKPFIFYTACSRRRKGVWMSVSIVANNNTRGQTLCHSQQIQIAPHRCTVNTLLRATCCQKLNQRHCKNMLISMRGNTWWIKYHMAQQEHRKSHMPSMHPWTTRNTLNFSLPSLLCRSGCCCVKWRYKLSFGTPDTWDAGSSGLTDAYPLSHHVLRGPWEGCRRELTQKACVCAETFFSCVCVLAWHQYAWAVFVQWKYQ